MPLMTFFFSADKASKMIDEHMLTLYLTHRLHHTYFTVCTVYYHTVSVLQSACGISGCFSGADNLKTGMIPILKYPMVFQL